MIDGVGARVRSLWRGVRRRGAVEAEMAEEFRHHLALRAADLERAGHAPAEALRQARLEFGSAEMHKDAARAARGLQRVDTLRVSWLDVKLGFRMLVKYPGLTLVGGLAMAFAIWVGAATFELATQVLRPTLPLPDGGRIVALRLWDAEAGRHEGRLAHDFVAWQEGLRSVEALGVYRTTERNLIAQGESGEPVEVAEISASAFRMTRVPPLLGRTLVADDERPGAPPVVVLGHEVWRTRFAGDSAVVGRTVRLGRTQTTVVGVMPQGFAFPVAQRLWAPLRVDPVAHAPRQGPALRVFGRLAPDVSLAEAQAELTTMGRRAAAESPETHEHLRPQVVPYARSIVDLDGWMALGVLSTNVPVVLLLVLICANVALLMFARAATREGEIVVRSALGASRGRIVAQLFAEALVLGGIAATLGLVAAGGGLRWVIGVVEAEFLHGARLPFWFRDRLSPVTVAYAVALTVLGAVIAGVVPGLKVTRGLSARLKQASAGGGGPRFGGVWTAVIVAQIAVTVAFPVVTLAVRHDAVELQSVEVGFPSQEFLSLRLEMDRDPPAGAGADTSRAAFQARFRTVQQELERRLRSEPGIVGVTSADLLPRMYHPHRLVDVDEGGAAPLHPQWPAYRVSAAQVGPGFFDVFAAPALAGRTFTDADHATDLGAPGSAEARGGVVVVNQSFVTRVLGGRNPIGRRVRYRYFEGNAVRTRDDPPGPWYEIVGVVRDMGMSVGEFDPKISGIYHPAPAGRVHPAQLAVHVRGDPTALAPRVRAVAGAVDPALRLYDVQRLDDVIQSELRFYSFWFRLLLVLTGIALALSLAGIYAVMSFTVARRTREIGVRIALGASAWRVLLAVFRRPLVQVTLGIVAGAALMGVMLSLAQGGVPQPRHLALLAVYAVFMMGVCLLACIVPTRRALRVEPTEALRADG